MSKNKYLNKFYISAFFEAAKNKTFQQQWMPIDTWASLMNHYYKATEGDIGGDELMRLLTLTSWINDAVNGIGEIETYKICLYRNSYRPKNSAKKNNMQLYC
jgi:hypothetical protein